MINFNEDSSQVKLNLVRGVPRDKLEAVLKEPLAKANKDYEDKKVILEASVKELETVIKEQLMKPKDERDPHLEDIRKEKFILMGQLNQLGRELEKEIRSIRNNPRYIQEAIAERDLENASKFSSSRTMRHTGKTAREHEKKKNRLSGK